MSRDETEEMSEVGLAGEAISVYNMAIDGILLILLDTVFEVGSARYSALYGENGLVNKKINALAMIETKEGAAKSGIDFVRDIYFSLLTKAKDDAIAAINGGTSGTPVDEAQNIPGESMWYTPTERELTQKDVKKDFL